MKILKSIASKLLQLRKTLSPNCREATRLQSDAIEQNLSPATRFGVRLHLFLCGSCRRYGKQIRCLSAAARQHPDKFQGCCEPLSPEARARLKDSLQQNRG